jgi:hypothetical protein
VGNGGGLAGLSQIGLGTIDNPEIPGVGAWSTFSIEFVGGGVMAFRNDQAASSGAGREKIIPDPTADPPAPPTGEAGITSVYVSGGITALPSGVFAGVWIDDVQIIGGGAVGKPGDADGDGDVDLDDFVILKNNFGASPLIDDRADFDGDGDVDLDDFVVLKQGFGQSIDALEPPVETVDLLAMDATDILKRHRRRPHHRKTRRGAPQSPSAWRGESFDALAASRLK